MHLYTSLLNKPGALILEDAEEEIAFRAQPATSTMYRFEKDVNTHENVRACVRC